jgi:tRNA 2-thiocytidine biosynthesis protein TtcA
MRDSSRTVRFRIPQIILDQADDIHSLFNGSRSSTKFKKLRKRLVRQTREEIELDEMIEPGARWLICPLGGKDSYTLLALLHELKRRGLLPVELSTCNLDQGQPDFPTTVLPKFLKAHAIDHRIEYQDTYSIVPDKVPPSHTMCALCSRLRRGNPYTVSYVKKAALLWCLAITVMIFLRPLS